MTTPSLNPAPSAKTSEENKEENTVDSSNEVAGGENTSNEVSSEAVAETKPATSRPCDWLIVPLKGENIEATHISTRKVFTGTVAEFNKMLRG